MVKIIRLNSIFCIFILASCNSNKMDGVDWISPKESPSYVVISPKEAVIINNDRWFRPALPPQITPPSPAHAPNYTPMNPPNFIPPPPPFNFVIDFGD